MPPRKCDAAEALPRRGPGRPRKPFCKRGHPLSGDNLRVRTKGGVTRRDCRACFRLAGPDRHRLWRQRARVARVMVATGHDRVTAERLVSEGYDLRRENAKMRRAIQAAEQTPPRPRTTRGQHPLTSEAAA